MSIDNYLEKIQLNEVYGDPERIDTWSMFIDYISQYLTKESRYVKKKCSGIREYELRRICQVGTRIEYKQYMLAFIRSKRHLCEKTKDPRKCHLKIIEKMNIIKANIQDRERKLQQLQKDRMNDIANTKNLSRYIT